MKTSTVTVEINAAEHPGESCAATVRVVAHNGQAIGPAQQPQAAFPFIDGARQIVAVMGGGVDWVFTGWRIDDGATVFEFRRAFDMAAKGN